MYWFSDVDEIVVLEFDKPNYIGTIDNNTLILDPILLVQGLSSDVVFTLQGGMFIYLLYNFLIINYQNVIRYLGAIIHSCFYRVDVLFLYNTKRINNYNTIRGHHSW